MVSADFNLNLTLGYLSGYNICWEWMGSGVPSGLQNQYEGLKAS